MHQLLHCRRGNEERGFGMKAQHCGPDIALRHVTKHPRPQHYAGVEAGVELGMCDAVGSGGGDEGPRLWREGLGGHGLKVARAQDPIEWWLLDGQEGCGPWGDGRGSISDRDKVLLQQAGVVDRVERGGGICAGEFEDCCGGMDVSRVSI